MEQELIIIEQLPVITERLALLSEEIDGRICAALALECTEETVKAVKALRSELTKDFGELENRRKAVKSSIMKPYERFEAAYKQYVSDKYRSADAQLKAKIDGVEGEIKQRKYDALKEYFDEYRLSRGADFIDMDSWRPNVTLTATLPALKKEGKAYVDRICDDLALIETQEHKTEILVEYRRSLNVSQAITSVAERHRAIEEQKRRQDEAEARRAAEQEVVKRVEAAAPAPLPAPTVAPVEDGDPMLTVGFKVTHRRSKLKELKGFLEDGGYQYE